MDLIIREVLTDDRNPELFYTLGLENDVWYYYINESDLDSKLNALLSTGEYTVLADDRKILKPDTI